jgi:hypothetical protein
MSEPKYDHAEIRRLAQLDTPTAEIAARMGCTEQTVIRALDGTPWSRRRHFVQFDEDERSFIEYLLEDGTPYTEVAATMSERRGEHLTAAVIAKRWPGYGIQSQSESLFVARAIRDFERLIRRLGLDQKESKAA